MYVIHISHLLLLFPADGYSGKVQQPIEAVRRHQRDGARRAEDHRVGNFANDGGTRGPVQRRRLQADEFRGWKKPAATQDREPMALPENRLPRRYHRRPPRLDTRLRAAFTVQSAVIITPRCVGNERFML